MEPWRPLLGKTMIFITFSHINIYVDVYEEIKNSTGNAVVAEMVRGKAYLRI